MRASSQSRARAANMRRKLRASLASQMLEAIGSHVIDGFRWLLSSEVDSVTCNLATHIRERKDHDGKSRAVTTDDEANLLLRFSDGESTQGATANVSMSMVEAGKPIHRCE